LQRVLPSGEIASAAPQPIPRLRLPDRQSVFAQRADRLRQLSANSTMGGYLRLAAALADAQQAALSHLQPARPHGDSTTLAREHRMPLVPAAGSRLPAHWHDVLLQMCSAARDAPGIPPNVTELCARLRATPRAELAAAAEAILAASHDRVDAAAAPFHMAALQVCWVDVASALTPDDVPVLDVAGVCPVCGSLPVASIVRTGKPYEGYRYLHCGLCATEWHMVRLKCSHCYAVEGVAFQLIEGGSQAVRAETCEQCRTYRKILYQEKDGDVEPLADDLASLSLDLLISDAGYRRASANPLLWQPAEA